MVFPSLSFFIPFSIFLPNVVIYLTASQEVKTETVDWARSPMCDHNQNWLNQGVSRSHFEPLFLWLASCFWKVLDQKAWHGCNTFNTGIFVKKTKQNETHSQTLCSHGPGQLVHSNIWEITVDFCFEFSGPYFELPRNLMFLLLNVFAVFPLYIFAWDWSCAHSTAACIHTGFAERVQWRKVLLYVWSEIIK